MALSSPLFVGQTLDLDVTGATDDGRGVARLDGFAVFVTGALEGERVTAVVERVHLRYAEALTRRILISSSERLEPPCPLYSACGGCSFLHASYPSQLRVKQNAVTTAFERVGKFCLADTDVRPILSMPSPYRYRNKAVFAIGGTRDKPCVGFRPSGSHAVLDVQDCLLLPLEASRAAEAVRAWIAKTDQAAYDPRTRMGLLRHVLVRVSDAGALVALIAYHDSVSSTDSLVAALRERVPNLRGVLLNINDRPHVSGDVFGSKTRALWGEITLTHMLLGISYRVSADAFFQVNPTQSEQLFGAAIALAEPAGAHLFDVYCGAGALTLPLARACRSAVGIEYSQSAVNNAVENALLNQVANASFSCARAEDEIPKRVARGERPDVIVLDPPRAGCAPEVLRAVISASPARVLYVSCNPQTLARDAALLSGYKLAAIQPVDMFPWTAHVETIALMVKA